MKEAPASSGKDGSSSHMPMLDSGKPLVLGICARASVAVPLSTPFPPAPAPQTALTVADPAALSENHASLLRRPAHTRPDRLWIALQERDLVSAAAAPLTTTRATPDAAASAPKPGAFVHTCATTASLSKYTVAVRSAMCSEACAVPARFSKRVC